MIHSLARWLTPTPPAPPPAGYPVFPLLGPLPDPGEDVSGGIATLSREAERRIDGVFFMEEAVVLLVAARAGERCWSTGFACDRPVFARMLDARGGVRRVLGAPVVIRPSSQGLTLEFVDPRRDLYAALGRPLD